MHDLGIGIRQIRHDRRRDVVRWRIELRDAQQDLGAKRGLAEQLDEPSRLEIGRREEAGLARLGDVEQRTCVELAAQRAADSRLHLGVRCVAQQRVDRRGRQCGQLGEHARGVGAAERARRIELAGNHVLDTSAGATERISRPRRDAAIVLVPAGRAAEDAGLVGERVGERGERVVGNRMRQRAEQPKLLGGIVAAANRATKSSSSAR